MTVTVRADPLDPSGVSAGHVRLSKRGGSLDVVAPAEGVLGQYEWFAEHLAEVQRRGRAFPLWVKPWGSRGRVSRAAAFTDAAAANEDEVRVALLDILEQPPLRMSAETAKQLKLRGHSLHGSSPDWARLIGEWPSPPSPAMPSGDPGFSDPSINALGWWLRKGEAQPPPQQRGRGRGRGRGSGCQAQPADDSARAGSMQLEYCSGDARVGVREQQLRLRRRLMGWARAALKAWTAHWRVDWWRLPEGRLDLRVLHEPVASVAPRAVPNVD